MKKICASMVVVLLVMASPLFADTITVSNTLTFDAVGATSSGDGTGEVLGSGWSKVNKINSAGDYVSWSQTFVFDSLAENDTLTGILTLYLYDDSVADDSSCIDGYEYALGYANSGQLALDEVNTGTYTYNVVLNNGTLEVFLTSLLGDFYIDKAVLDVTYTTAAAAPVPEPTSLLLLGVGMLSAGLFTRKRNKQG